MQLKPLPISKATTSYELLQEVYDLIEEKPLCLRMDYCFSALNNPHIAELVEEMLHRPVKSEEVPECGTVACYAGWVCVLRAEQHNHRSRMNTAHEILIGTHRSPEGGEVEKDLLDLFYNFPSEVWGTQEYTDAVLHNLRRYMDKHEAFLKARLLPPIGVMQ